MIDYIYIYNIYHLLILFIWCYHLLYKLDIAGELFVAQNQFLTLMRFIGPHQYASRTLRFVSSERRTCQRIKSRMPKDLKR